MIVIGKETSYMLKSGVGKPAIDAYSLRPFRIVSFVASILV
jgi:hypothetical protein